MSEQTSANWFPDPFGRYEHRYWNGTQWTEHVASSGQPAVDAPVFTPPPPPQPPVPSATRDAISSTPRSTTPDLKVQRQLQKFGLTEQAQAGGGTLFTERVLVVNQKGKLFEKKAEYSFFDQKGHKIGSAKEFGQSLTRAAVGSSNMTRRLRIIDENGAPVLILTRPAVVLKPKVIVTRDDGTTVGQIAQDNLGILAQTLGGRFNVRFRLESGGVTFATLNTESWQAWNFSILDSDGAEIARITRTWAGLGRETFTKADNYVLEIHRQLEDPLLSLVVAAAIAVDTVLRQESN